MDDLEVIPLNSYDLIDALDKLCPQECIRPGESLEAAHRRAGMRDLIQILVVQKQEEIDGALSHRD